MGWFASAAQRAASKKMDQPRIPRNLALNAMVAEIVASVCGMLGESSHPPRPVPSQTSIKGNRGQISITAIAML